MIINLRGASCSGKSTPVYQLLANYPHVEQWEQHGWNLKKERLIGYSVGDLLIIGPYAATAKTGGMDMLTPGRIELVTQWLEERIMSGQWRHVIFESLMCSLAMGRYQDLARRTEHGPCGRTAFCFLNTPLEVRRERIFARNGGLGPSGKGINVEATLEHQHIRMGQIRQKFIEANELVYDVDWQNAFTFVRNLLHSEGWDPYGPVSSKVEARTLIEIGQAAARGELRFSDEKRQTRLEKELKDHARALQLTPDMLQCQS